MSLLYVKIGAIVLAVILAFCIGIAVIGKTQKRAFSFDEIEEESLTKAAPKVRMFGYEKMLFNMLKIKQPTNTLLWLERCLIVAVGLGAAYFIGWLVVYFLFEVFMFFYTKNREKTVEDANGLTYIPKTNAFLDMYIPAVNNGESVNQIMDRFVDQESDPDLTKWWFDEHHNFTDVPMQWNDVIKIYANGYYNEQNGFEDSSEIFQKDIVRQQTYYNNFKEKVGEIGPIKMCYYIFMPICCCISYFNDPTFWKGFWGAIDTGLLCVLLFVFSFLLSNLHKDTCEKLF